MGLNIEVRPHDGLRFQLEVCSDIMTYTTDKPELVVRLFKKSPTGDETVLDIFELQDYAARLEQMREAYSSLQSHPGSVDFSKMGQDPWAVYDSEELQDMILSAANDRSEETFKLEQQQEVMEKQQKELEELRAELAECHLRIAELEKGGATASGGAAVSRFAAVCKDKAKPSITDVMKKLESNKDAAATAMKLSTSVLQRLEKMKAGAGSQSQDGKNEELSATKF